MGLSKLGVTSLSHWIGWPTYIFAPGCLIINKVCVGHKWQFWFVWNKHQKLIPKIYRIFMVSYSQFTEYQNIRTVFRKLWCVSDVHAPHALCSQRFSQSLRSRTKYIVSLLSTRDSCVTCYCNHHFTTGGLLTWNFLPLLHNYSLADLCFTISPSNLNRELLPIV